MSARPMFLVDASMADVMVPQQFVKENQIVLNISPDAVVDLNISNQAVAFNGRFWWCCNRCFCTDFCSRGNLCQGKWAGNGVRSRGSCRATG